MDIAWLPVALEQGRGDDYINCPLDKDQYHAFVQALIDGEKTEFREWEKDTPYFEGCMPIEVMAERGPETLRFGPMKGVGLDDPRTGRWPYAVVQLRQDNAQGTLWNIVGFQTKLKHAEQVRLFRTIPGLENAEFARLGGLHRNTFIRSPELLDPTLRLKSRPNIRFAGQITGCEGYVESAAIGLLAGRFAAAELRGDVMTPPPVETALGALLHHITGGAEAETYQPMNVNFGLFPPIPGRTKKADRKKMYTDRARADLRGVAQLSSSAGAALAGIRASGRWLALDARSWRIRWRSSRRICRRRRRRIGVAFTAHSSNDSRPSWFDVELGERLAARPDIRRGDLAVPILVVAVEALFLARLFAGFRRRGEIDVTVSRDCSCGRSRDWRRAIGTRIPKQEACGHQHQSRRRTRQKSPHKCPLFASA